MQGSYGSTGQRDTDANNGTGAGAPAPATAATNANNGGGVGAPAPATATATENPTPARPVASRVAAAQAGILKVRGTPGARAASMVAATPSSLTSPAGRATTSMSSAGAFAEAQAAKAAKAPQATGGGVAAPAPAASVSATKLPVEETPARRPLPTGVGTTGRASIAGQASAARVVVNDNAAATVVNTADTGGVGAIHTVRQGAVLLETVHGGTVRLTTNVYGTEEGNAPGTVAAPAPAPAPAPVRARAPAPAPAPAPTTGSVNDDDPRIGLTTGQIKKTGLTRGQKWCRLAAGVATAVAAITAGVLYAERCEISSFPESWKEGCPVYIPAAENTGGLALTIGPNSPPAYPLSNAAAQYMAADAQTNGTYGIAFNSMGVTAGSTNCFASVNGTMYQLNNTAPVAQGYTVDSDLAAALFNEQNAGGITCEGDQAAQVVITAQLNQAEAHPAAITGTVNYAPASPSPTSSATATATVSPAGTMSATSSGTATASASGTPGASPTSTPSSVPTNPATNTASATASSAPTLSATNSGSSSATSTPTQSPSPTATASAAGTPTPAPAPGNIQLKGCLPEQTVYLDVEAPIVRGSELISANDTLPANVQLTLNVDPSSYNVSSIAAIDSQTGAQLLNSTSTQPGQPIVVNLPQANPGNATALMDRILVIGDFEVPNDSMAYTTFSLQVTQPGVDGQPPLVSNLCSVPVTFNGTALPCGTPTFSGTPTPILVQKGDLFSIPGLSVTTPAGSLPRTWVLAGDPNYLVLKNTTLFAVDGLGNYTMANANGAQITEALQYIQGELGEASIPFQTVCMSICAKQVGEKPKEPQLLSSCPEVCDTTFICAKRNLGEEENKQATPFLNATSEQHGNLRGANQTLIKDFA